MKNKNTLLIILLSFSLFFASLSYSSADSTEKIVEESKVNDDGLEKSEANPTDYDSNINLASYTDHAPIWTSSTSELAAISNSGSGTAISPYIIEGWKITATDTFGIAIFTTTTHFTIRNCWIIMTTIDEAIYIPSGLGFDTIKIENNIIEGGSTAIWALTGGIDMVNNTLINNRFGITCANEPENIIANNTIINSDVLGASISYAKEVVVENNTFVDCGLSLKQFTVDDYLACTVKDNTMNGLPHGYFESEEDIIISEPYGEILLVNCTNVVVTDQIFDSSNTGIKLASCNSTVIKDCLLNTDTQGIEFDLCYNCSVIDSEITNSGTGIYFGRSSYCVLNNSRLIENTYNTIYDSDHCNITWNYFNGNYKQLDMQSSSSNNIFHHNVIISGNYDEAVDDGSSNLWYDTTMLEGNIWSDYSGSGEYPIAGSAGNTDPYPNNFAHPEFNVHSFIEIGSDAEFNSTNGVSSGTGIVSDPFIIENWIINVPNDYHGIYIHDTTAFFVIRNCYIDAGTGGSPNYDSAIFVNNTAEATVCIEDNVLLNSNYGIHLKNSDDNLIENNLFEENTKGLVVYNSDNTSIYVNEFISNSEDGIRVTYSDNSMIVGNYLTDSHTGIKLDNSHYSYVGGNNISLMYSKGIDLFEADGNSFTYNWITGSNYGIFVDFSANSNVFHHNNFIGNTEHAYDPSSSSTWYDTVELEGNFWDDYSGTGAYSIMGGASDPYPLGEIPGLPEINQFNLLAIVLVLVPVAIVRRRKR
ncbi:MAG: NosD domain-containing protein [Candidatus Kariarchaeaceae archaeon]